MLNNNLSFTETMQTYSPNNPLANDCRLIENFAEFLNCKKAEKLLSEIVKNLPDTVNECLELQ
jgi:hypothetical protein